MPIWLLLLVNLIATKAYETLSIIYLKDAGLTDVLVFGFIWSYK